MLLASREAHSGPARMRYPPYLLHPSSELYEVRWRRAVTDGAGCTSYILPRCPMTITPLLTAGPAQTLQEDGQNNCRAVEPWGAEHSYAIFM